MKKAYRFCMSLLLCISPIIYFVPFKCNAQDCNTSFYQMREGSSFTLTSYNPNNKPLFRAENTYSKINYHSNGHIAQIKRKIFNAKDKPLNDISYNISCENGLLRLNVQDLMGPEMNLQDASLTVELTGDAMELPSRLKIGQHLRDAKLYLKAKKGEETVVEQELKVKFRKVDAIETIETPAGTYDCYKVSNMIMLLDAAGIPRRTMKTVAWYAVGPGMVKTASYNEKGKLISYSLLTAFSE